MPARVGAKRERKQVESDWAGSASKHLHDAHAGDADAAKVAAAVDGARIGHHFPFADDVADACDPLVSVLAVLLVRPYAPPVRPHLVDDVAAHVAHVPAQRLFDPHLALGVGYADFELWCPARDDDAHLCLEA